MSKSTRKTNLSSQKAKHYQETTRNYQQICEPPSHLSHPPAKTQKHTQRAKAEKELHDSKISNEQHNEALKFRSKVLQKLELQINAYTKFLHFFFVRIFACFFKKLKKMQTQKT